MPRQLPTTLRPRISRSSPRRKPPPSRSQSAAAVPDINAPSRTVRPPFRLFDPFSAGLGTRLWLGYPLGLSASALKAKLFGGYPSVSTQRLSRLPFVPPSPRSSIPESIDIVSYLARQRKWMRRLFLITGKTACNWVLATLPHWQHSICLFSSEILVNGEFRLFDEDAFERREVVLHVNPPCGSQRFYYTKSAAHREPQIGYFLIKMSRKPPLFHPRSGRLIFALPHPDELVCIIAAPLRLGEKF